MRASRAADPVARYFDEVAQDYLAAYQATVLNARSFLFQERRQTALALLACPLEGTVADIGCGPAIFADAGVTGPRWIFIDLSEAMIRQARRHLESAWGPRAACVVADAERLPLPGESADAVICLGVLDYVADPRPTLEQVFQTLKPGGIFIVSIPNRLSLLGLSYRVARTLIGPLVRHTRLLDPCFPATSLLRQPGVRLREYRPSQMVRELEALGFGIQEIRWIGFLCPLTGNWQIRRFSRLARWLARTLSAPLSLWLARTCVIAARKQEGLRPPAQP